MCPTARMIISARNNNQEEGDDGSRSGRNATVRKATQRTVDGDRRAGSSCSPKRAFAGLRVSERVSERYETGLDGTMGPPGSAGGR